MCQHISRAHNNSMKGNHKDTPGNSHVQEMLKTKAVVQYDSFISANLPISNDSHMNTFS